MKIRIGLFVLFCLFTGNELLAQDLDITGTWTMFEMTWTSGDDAIHLKRTAPDGSAFVVNSFKRKES